MNALATIPSPEQMNVVKMLAETYVKSGLFKDTADVSKAIVKITLGMTIGIGPVESMMGINIIQGRIALAANLMASKVKGGGKYDYRVIESTAETCLIHFFQKGEFIGQAGYTIEEAKQANLTSKSTWQQYPADMLFNRALSRGARRFCPDAFGAASVYTPEELGAEIDVESGQITKMPEGEAPTFIEGEVVTPPQRQQPVIVSKEQAVKELNEIGEAVYQDEWPAVRENLVAEESSGIHRDPSKLMMGSLKKLTERLTAQYAEMQKPAQPTTSE